MPFKEIKGQDAALEIISANQEAGRLEGGYLFVGPGSVGKKMAAKVLSQSLNCVLDNNDACGVCPSCIKIEKNQHPDVHIIPQEAGEDINPVRNHSATINGYGVSNGIKIEEVRQLQKEINLKAYEGRFKVFIIDNAHKLTPEASNCLLKVLEEPPKRSLIILITDKPGILFKTILSRCKVIKFKAQDREGLKEALKENYGLDPGFSHFLAYFCEGRIGEALRLKELGILKTKNNIIDKLLIPASFSLEGLGIEDRQSFFLSLNILNTWFRDLFLLKTGIIDAEVINSDRKNDLLKSMSSFSYSDLERILNAISNTVFYLERNINTRLLLHNLKAQIWER
ncbi:MAG: DNA polymerase III subunit delta' [Candidatus Omnitrophica bacterium]|nr:DNA polymerase III subunit delta' [Candidatus Omnitrophota bacterium]